MAFFLFYSLKVYNRNYRLLDILIKFTFKLSFGEMSLGLLIPLVVIGWFKLPTSLRWIHFFYIFKILIIKLMVFLRLFSISVVVSSCVYVNTVHWGLFSLIGLATDFSGSIPLDAAYKGSPEVLPPATCCHTYPNSLCSFTALYFKRKPSV